MKANMNLLKVLPEQPGRKRRVRRGARRWAIERLEERVVLSTMEVAVLADSGPGSLRQAILEANATPGDDIIAFDEGLSGTIHLASVLPDLSTNIEIQGPGADLLTVRRDTGGNYRIFTVGSGATVTLAGLTISNGKLNDYLGGAGLLNSGTLTLSHVVVSGNETGGWGGGIYNSTGATLTVTGSTLSGNDGATGGGGICNGGGAVTVTASTISGNIAALPGGGVHNNGTLTVTNSTIDGNQVWWIGGGGGIFNESGTVTVTSSTITRNYAPGLDMSNAGGGGIWNSGTLHSRNTIIAGNSTDVPLGPDLSGNLSTSGHNLIGDTSGGGGFDPTDLLNVDPLLGPLADNGGPTFTRALLPGSPAIDAGIAVAGITTDQRGVARPQGAGVDIGAYEAVDLTTLQVALAEVTSTGVILRFSSPIDPAVLNLYDTAYDGLGAADVTLVGATTGVVRGSLVVAADRTSVTFLRSGGLLPHDMYTLTLRSAANGFKDATGELLDGDADGIAGGDYTTSFAGGTAPAIVVSVGDVVRGPGQAADAPLGSGGIPVSIHLEPGLDVTRVDFQVRYNPALLNLTTATLGASVPGDWSITTTFPSAGVMEVQATGTTALAAGASRIIHLVGEVPEDALYADKQVLDLANLVVRTRAGYALDSADDDGLHVVAYAGDTMGDAVMSAVDVTAMRRVIVGLDSGFAGLQQADPRIVGDVNGDGELTPIDVTVLRRFLTGLSQTSIPSIRGDVTIVPSGLDPRISLPRNLEARPGQMIRVPVLFEQTDVVAIPFGSFDAAIAFDPRIFTLVDVSAGALAPADEFLVLRDAGLVHISAAAMERVILEPGTAGVLAWLTLRVNPRAAAGAAVLNLLESARSATRGLLPTLVGDGRLVLNPAPTNAADDAVDGVVQIRRNVRRVVRGWQNLGPADEVPFRRLRAGLWAHGRLGGWIGMGKR